jgi:protein-disulfide isomerase
MTNEVLPSLKRIGKILFALFLLFLTMLIFNTLFSFSRMEKKLGAGEVDYSRLNEKELTAPTDQKLPLQNEEQSKLILGDGTNYSLGSEKGRIQIIEFADLACPVCAKAYPTIRELVARYPDDIHYVFRDLPIVTSFSSHLALAARCAGEQGLFWNMHDRLFQNQDTEDRAAIMTLAQKTGLRLPEFENCYDSQKFQPKIQKDFSDAEALGLLEIGTPIWYINGQRVEGEIPLETFERIITELK